jgi:ERCC4-type nuclease
MFDTLPRLRNFCENPVLLCEENFGIDQTGHLFNRGDSRETDMLATSYFGYLETIRKSGVEVITTRDLNQSIYWMIAMHGYLGKGHYPKHRKYHSVKEQARGVLMCVPGIGEARAGKVLKNTSISEMLTSNKFEGLTMTQAKKLNEIARYRNVW